MNSFPTSLLLIGCGNMAGAMLSRWLACGLDPSIVTVVRPSGTAVAGGVLVVAAPPAGPAPEIVLLGVKPQQLESVAAAWRDRIGAETILVSILAGVERRSLAARFPQARAIVRAMPNMPVAIGQGAVALVGGTDGAVRAAVERLMRPLGLVEWLADEALLDAVAALAASGPAFVYRFVDALAAAGAALGIPPDQAARLALATVAGAGALAVRADQTPRRLAEQVASPGGMTREGLDVLDADGALAALVGDTLAAAARHSRAMGATARRSGAMETTARDS